MRRKLFGTKRRGIITLVVLVSLVAASVGLAAWLWSGTGTGAASGEIGPATNIATITITGDPTGAGTGKVVPGTPGKMAFFLTSTATAPTTIVSASAGTPVVDSGGTNCVPTALAALTAALTTSVSPLVQANWTINAVPNTLTVPANANNVGVLVSNAYTLAANADPCLQGVKFHVPLTLSTTG